MDRCAALEGRDLVPDAAHRAVRRGTQLRFCARGGKVRRLGGSPVVRQAQRGLVLLHRRGRVEALDVATGRRARLGRVGEIVHPRVRDSAGVVAVRRTAAGDALIIAAPGRPELMVEQGPERVEALDVDDEVSWRRAGVDRYALLPLRRVRCADVIGEDRLAGPGRVTLLDRVAPGFVHVGCTGAAGAPTYVLDELPASLSRVTPGGGSWVLRELGDAESHGPYRDFRTYWGIVNLATGRTYSIASHSGGDMADWSGERLMEHVLLADGRFAAILDHNFFAGVASQSRVEVEGTQVDETERGAPKATNLRVEGEVVRWTVGGEERSAPLPPAS